MTISKNWILAITLLLALPCQACAGAVGITIYPISGTNKHAFSLPYSGHFKAANGEAFDASQYYKPLRSELNVSGLLAVFLSDGYTLKLDWLVDLGYHSDLYIVQPSVLSGLSVIKSSDKLKIKFGIQNLFFIGGKVSKNSCVDELQREFHCGTGQPWSDYRGYSIKPNMGIHVTWTTFF